MSGGAAPGVSGDPAPGVSGDPAPGGRPRRELRAAVLLCLAGAALVLLAVSQTWFRSSLPEAPPLPSATERLAGSLLLPGARPLALVALAGIAALFAARRGGRVVVGLLVLLAGAGVVALDVRLLLAPAEAVRRAELSRQVSQPLTGAPQLGPWPLLCLVGGLLIAAAGLLFAVRGRRWAALSRSYEVPAARVGSGPEGGGDKAVWDAMDRGQDT